MAHRPRIAILGRFAESTSVTRYAAIVTAKRLADFIWQSGGEPLTLLPVANSDWAERLHGIDGVLMPGGSDVDPQLYGEEPASDEIYGVDPLQDDVDLSLVRYVLDAGIPLFTVCRGTQITNVALGGSLHQHVNDPHLYHVDEVAIHRDHDVLGLSAPTVTASCYHHQAINRLGDGVTPIAHSVHGHHIEAVTFASAGWAAGVQWHPEDNFDTDPAQLEIGRRFISEAIRYRATQSPT
ncbi:MAG: gamma-glutamyl-gamma-aminobutyrate hydrolase family protein [Microbacteriaceae bacterium]